jgi:hypothetical protein
MAKKPFLEVVIPEVGRQKALCAPPEENARSKIQCDTIAGKIPMDYLTLISQTVLKITSLIWAYR